MMEDVLMKEQETKAPERRRFLKQVMALGGGGALVLFSMPEPEVPASGHDGTGVPETRGYRMTGHIRAYYESARS